MKVIILAAFIIFILLNVNAESSTVRCGRKLFDALREVCTPAGYKYPCFTSNDVFIDIDGKKDVNLHRNIVNLCCSGQCTPDITSQLCCNEIEQAAYDLTNVRSYQY
uniref:Uncharacterized protein n=1 Tax=Panagrolaimus sp. PS1159 TaxID=55785 RepID=A0AC35EV48_9BILA